MKRFFCILTAVCMLLTMNAAVAMAGTEPAQDPEQADQLQAEESIAAEDMSAAADDQKLPQMKAAYEEPQQADVSSHQAEAAQQQPAVAAESSDRPRQPELTGEAQNSAKQSLPAVKKLKAYAGYKQIKLKWAKVKGAETYIIQRKVKGGSWEQVGTSKTKVFIDDVEMYTKYYYRVYAVNGVAKSKPAKISKKCVSRMRIYITFRSTKRYGKGVKVKAGERVMSDRYGGGKYYFKADNGKYYSVARFAVRNQKADYVKTNKKDNNNYSKAEATFFINQYLDKAKIKSNKKYLIWVSSYNQHVYVFKKSKGKWVATKHNWECSMGKASTPSPTGNKVLHQKIAHRHGISYWNCFSSLNALHGVHSGWGSLLGRLASHGCIRNKTENAKWIYYNCSKGTKVIVF